MESEIQIRRMERQDLPEIQKLYQDLIQEGVSLDTLLRNWSTVEGHPHYYPAVAVRKGRILGSAVGIVCIAPDTPFLVVENMIVAADCRGQGIGTVLSDAMDRFAAEHHCQYALLVSSGFRKGAHSFYETMGYVDDVRGFRKYYAP